MICINCFHEKTTVRNTRYSKQRPETWRRHTCPKCQHTFTTYERPSSDSLLIADDQGHTTPFNLGKLIISIARSFQHNAHAAAYDSLFIAQTVEMKIMRHSTSPATTTIAAMTHETLKRYDPLAAMQYAAQHQLTSAIRRRGRPSITAS